MQAPGADVATRSAPCSCDVGQLDSPTVHAAMGEGAVAYLLDPHLESVRTARRFTRAALEGWGIGSWYDDVGLVVSELVTNALSHALHIRGGGTQRSLASARGAPNPIRLTLTRQKNCVISAVSDPSSRVPMQRKPDSLAGEGHGLALIERLSHSWDWMPLPHGGKTIWAVFCASKAAPKGTAPRSIAGPHKLTRQRPSGEPRLTPEEVSILNTVATGVPLDVAARQQGVSPRTLRRRVRATCDRIGVHTTIEAVVWAAKHQLI
jgi:DNA-binding CsgD family transcriptional regulator